ncbi:class I SAM-dependent methyltransferase [Azospirillum agricola]|uniref:class I SAM-dependent methyltransferase n=1 Tax=Azospirillum agricola TaxID=1720247 RepID=UPI000A0EFAEA|nr:class I SAM-dependent methyltransferase [Azospirillum agricola]SMH41221.1 Methyltransferase domain-containing protein [Azospirillum lipoferum]
MPAGKGIDNKSVYARPDVAEQFDAQRRIGEDDFVYRWEVDRFVGQARLLMGSEAPGSVVDVGAGTGKLSLAFARLGWRVTAFDHSDAMLAQLVRKAEAEGLTIACRSGDIRDLEREFSGERHDVAVSSRVLMHVADPAAMIAGMVSVADRGVVLDAPRRLSPNRLLVAARALTGGEVYRCFDDAFLTGTLARHGADTVDLVRMFTLPISLHVKLRSPALSGTLEAGLAPLRGLASTAFVTARRRAG